ncbi:c-type cytochrome [Salinisphaera aquimarina]|uniref:C-type cytochrome n=1 Tax=Salinisphaera aquimarina TaxID=2094031 RepID=A0ABV7EMW5_9GAMM
MMQAVSRIVMFAALVGLSAVAFAQGEHGEQDKPADSDWVAQATQTCASCHGKNGVSQTATFPVLAGQHQNYLLHSLKAYRDGGRKNGIMAGQVQNMTDAQLKALATYFSQQSAGPLHTPHVD